MTLRQTFGRVEGLKLAFVGDTNNNMTYDLMRAACICGMTMTVAGPPGNDFAVAREVCSEPMGRQCFSRVFAKVLRECELLSNMHGGKAIICSSAEVGVFCNRSFWYRV